MLKQKKQREKIDKKAYAELKSINNEIKGYKNELKHVTIQITQDL